jgi:hypothetical protein
MLPTEEIAPRLPVVPLFRLESEIVEETELWDIDAKIDELSRAGETVETLLERRQHVLQRWHQRIEDELAKSGDSNQLRHERERISHYSDIPSR